MSDEKLRALERRWRESGSAEDEAAWLAERLRTGGLTIERLRLAAHCRHPAALHLLPAVRPGWATRLTQAFAGRWVLPGLQPFGKEVSVRALVLVAREVLRDCAAHIPDTRPAEAVEAAEVWARDPTEPNRRRAIAAAHAADDAFSWLSGARGRPPPGMTGPPPIVFGTEQLAAVSACAAPARAVNDDNDMGAEGAAVVALRFFRGGSPGELLQEIQTAIRTGLVEWALDR